MANPQATLLPTLMQRPNFEPRVKSHVTRLNLTPEGKQATGVTYIDRPGQ